MREEALEIRLPGPPNGETPALVGRRYHFSDGGPRVLVTAALHGNEVNGIGAAWQLQERLRGASLTGTVTVIPCVNQLAAMGKGRRIPGEDTDLNRFLPGNEAGYLAERLAARLARLLDEHDALVDIHTSGWCVPHLLLDTTPDDRLARRLESWAASAGLPVVLEMDGGLAELQGLGRSWSAYAVRQGKPALTVELPGFLTLSRREAYRGGELLLQLLSAARSLGSPIREPCPAWRRTELHGNCSGLFEAYRDPGDRLAAREVLGVIRDLTGGASEEVQAPLGGLLLVLQSGSAVHPGSWLATLGCELPTPRPVGGLNREGGDDR